MLSGITASTPEQMAEVIYEAVTDGIDQLFYPAGDTTKVTYADAWKLVRKL